MFDFLAAHLRIACSAAFNYHFAFFAAQLRAEEWRHLAHTRQKHARRSKVENRTARTIDAESAEKFAFSVAVLHTVQTSWCLFKNYNMALEVSK